MSLQYLFWIEMEGKRRESLVDMSDYGWNKESWDSMNENQQQVILGNIFDDQMDNMCSSGYYQVEEK